MHTYRRHTLLTINEHGRKLIYDKAVAGGMDTALCARMLLAGLAADDEEGRVYRGANSDGLPLPGIVRRSDTKFDESLVPVGFTSWASGAMGRLRLAGFVSREDVLRADDPFAVLRHAVDKATIQGRTPALCALLSIAETPGESCFPDATVGVWGSAGMELATGYFYTHAQSDLDIILAPKASLDRAHVDEWHATLSYLECKFATRIDAEIRLESGYDVSLKELHGGSRKVLGKSTKDVTLLDHPFAR